MLPYNTLTKDNSFPLKYHLSNKSIELILLDRIIAFLYICTCITEIILKILIRNVEEYSLFSRSCLP